MIGDLDASSAATFEHALHAHELDADPDRPVEIDVQGVGFMDSSGLRTLVAASLRASRRGTRVVLRNSGPQLTRLLEITGLAERFGVQRRTDDSPWWSPPTSSGD